MTAYVSRSIVTLEGSESTVSQSCTSLFGPFHKNTKQAAVLVWHFLEYCKISTLNLSQTVSKFRCMW